MLPDKIVRPSLSWAERCFLGKVGGCIHSPHMAELRCEIFTINILFYSSSSVFLFLVLWPIIILNIQSSEHYMFMCSVGLSKVGRYYVSVFKSHVQVIKAFCVFHTHSPHPGHLPSLPPSFPLLPPFLCFLPAEQWRFWGLPCVFSYKACPYGLCFVDFRGHRWHSVVTSSHVLLYR